MSKISPARWKQIADPDTAWNTRSLSAGEVDELAAIVQMAAKLVARLDQFHPAAMGSQRSAMREWSPVDFAALDALENLNVEGRT